MSETPNTVHGRLLEAAHISGYTAKRAVSELEWLLEENRWREVGQGYDDINVFLASIDLSEFKLAIERRKPLARKLAELEATQRATAKALGVSQPTIARDSDESPRPEKPALTQGSEVADDSDESPAAFQIPSKQVVESVEKQAKRKKREKELDEKRKKQEAEARRKIKELDTEYELAVSDLRDWRPENVNAIITDPPYVGDAIPLYEALRDFAADVLPDGAPLVVMTWQAILPDVIDALRHDALAYRWTICWRYANTENTVDHKRRVFDCWKPVLVYHRTAIPEAVPMFRDEIASDSPDKSLHEWGQSLEGFERLITSFSEPGDLVCDPFTGGGTTAVAALASARRFVGCDSDAEAIAITRRRIAA